MSKYKVINKVKPIYPKFVYKGREPWLDIPEYDTIVEIVVE